MNESSFGMALNPSQFFLCDLSRHISPHALTRHVTKIISHLYSQIAKKVEAESLRRKITTKIQQNGNPEEIKNLIVKFKSCFV